LLLRLRRGNERLHRHELTRPRDRDEFASIDVQPGETDPPTAPRAGGVVRLREVERANEACIAGIAPPLPGTASQLVGVGNSTLEIRGNAVDLAVDFLRDFVCAGAQCRAHSLLLGLTQLAQPAVLHRGQHGQRRDHRRNDQKQADRGAPHAASLASDYRANPRAH